MIPCLHCSNTGLVERALASENTLDFTSPIAEARHLIKYPPVKIQDYCDCATGTRLMEQSMWEVGAVLMRFATPAPIIGIIIGKKGSTITVQWQDQVYCLSLLNDLSSDGIRRLTVGWDV